MRIVGIVAEYNPFHNGHLYQIQQIKHHLKPDGIIVIMSGQFTQRGTPCIVDKFTRTQMALANGVDLVLELPFPFATASAETFATAAVNALTQSGIVTDICFGSETPDMALFNEVASTLIDEPTEVSQAIQLHLSRGISYPVARQTALIDYLSAHGTSNKQSLIALLSNPNNILGIEYTKALLKTKSTIRPFALQRQSAQYHDITITSPIASATAIRQHFVEGSHTAITAAMPENSSSLLFDYAASAITLDTFSDLLQYKLIFSNLEDLYALWDIPKNLCESLMNAYPMHPTIQGLIDAVSSKTYTRATVSRSILRILFGVSDDFMTALRLASYTPYLRVLGCHPDAKPLMAHLCKAAQVPVITQFKKGYASATPLGRQLLDLEIAASRVYASKTQQPALYDADFTKSIFLPPNTPL